MAVINPHEISEQMYVGSVAAAVLTKKGNIYTGVCIDTSSSLGMCAEENAMSTMLTNGENEVEKVVSVYKDGTVMPPCGGVSGIYDAIREKRKRYRNPAQ